MLKINKNTMIIVILLLLAIILGLSIATESEERTICEKYAESKNIKIFYPTEEYSFDGEIITREELEELCLNAS